jgi:hypothetical protein
MWDLDEPHLHSTKVAATRSTNWFSYFRSYPADKGREAELWLRYNSDGSWDAEKSQSQQIKLLLDPDEVGLS